MIFVHGLLSIPQMWVPTVTAVESDPVLRGRYQFWAFAYPTGDPIALSALRLRESLARVYQLYPKTKDVVLISHSMGGLLSQMQAVTTERVLWDRVFRGYADQVYAELPPDNVVKRALIFRCRIRGLARIVFICVPHRGSVWRSTGWAQSASHSFICRTKSSPASATWSPHRSKRVLALSGCRQASPGLSPQSPLLGGLDTLAIRAPYHAIIGDRGKGDTPNSSDGVVAYWSSHIAGAKSELIVPGPHGSFALPQTVSELERILRLHLAAVPPPRKGSKKIDFRLTRPTRGPVDHLP